MLYADDLTLTANDHTALQTMLNRLHSYAQRKHLIINTSKSKVVHFNSSGLNLPEFCIEGVRLVHKDCFKYLGMMFHKRMSMAKSSEHAAGPFMASAYRIRQFVQEKSLAGRPHVSLWLGKTYVVPAGMYGGQVWGTEYLGQGQEFKSDLQVRHMSFLKSTRRQAYHHKLGCFKGVWARACTVLLVQGKQCDSAEGVASRFEHPLL
jgi:hypothetical protein